MVSFGGKRPVSTVKKSLKDTAYERIKEDIFSQHFVPLDTLVEADLAERYGMSKTPVREALVALAVDGLVEITGRRRVRVARYTTKDVREIYDLREVVEPAALRWAAPRITPEVLEELRSTLDAARVAAERNEVRELSQLNREFHRLLIQECDNKRIIHLLNNLRDQLRMIALVSWSSGMSFDFEHREHDAIFRALEQGQTERAVEELRSHIQGFYTRFKESPAAATDR
jgi:DNA-binding GntR family transcriptional regulator